jgi:hypothetical protein
MKAAITGHNAVHAQCTFLHMHVARIKLMRTFSTTASLSHVVLISFGVLLCLLKSCFEQVAWMYTVYYILSTALVLQCCVFICVL